MLHQPRSFWVVPHIRHRDAGRRRRGTARATRDGYALEDGIFQMNLSNVRSLNLAGVINKGGA